MELMKGQPNVTSRDENTITNMKMLLDVFKSRLDTAGKKKSVCLNAQQYNRGCPNVSTKKKRQVGALICETAPSLTCMQWGSETSTEEKAGKYLKT